ncbi:hypothetical protein ACHAXH_006570 [Discostella pseudostelligera]
MKMSGHQQQLSNSDVNWGGRKYNIAPEFLTSPYLSKPIGFYEPEKRRQKNDSLQQASKSTRRRRTESDAESVMSFRTQRSSASKRSQQSYRSSRSSLTKHMAVKNILLPREIDKLCREFRQKHSLHPILKTQVEEQIYDDDTSTIDSEFAESLDDKAVYLHCHTNHDVENAMFSGGLFAEMAYRNATKERSKGPIVKLPPIRLIHHEKTSGDVSDLDSLHSGPDQGGRRKR